MAAKSTTPMEYLSAITLESIDGDRQIMATELWKDCGAVIMEAAQLSSVKSQLDAKKVGLYAVVHEKLGVPEFKKFFSGEVLFDPKRGFYGPEERWSSLTAIFRPAVMSGIISTVRKGVSGNLKGEGRLLGGLFVIGSGSQGVLFEHREQYFGDRASTKQVLEAVGQIKQS